MAKPTLGMLISVGFTDMEMIRRGIKIYDVVLVLTNFKYLALIYYGIHAMRTDLFLVRSSFVTVCFIVSNVWNFS